jgi:acyl-CoA reductase-like NAD-dependent aldehyde dehydrogenase
MKKSRICWIRSAQAAGAKVLCGGNLEGVMLEPTVMEEVPDNQDLSCQEAFGPVTILERFHDFDAALDRINDSRFGLQAGIFTRDLYKANRAWDKLEVGGVVIGDAPSWRVDHMPYGGVKDSGLGREGIRFAIEDMTEIRMMVVRTPTSS